MVRDRDLRASLEAIGQLQPAYEHESELIDGRRRREICAELGLTLRVVRLETLHDACSVLWTLHPSRALELAGKRPLLELAQLCSASTSAIASQLQAMKPRKSHKATVRILPDQPYRELKATPRMIRRLITLEPELYAYGREAAAQKGHRNFNKLVRDALWKEIALTVPNAPLYQPKRVQPANGARRKTG